MYARHFDLKQDPFSIAPDPRFLFMSDRHREALAHLLFGVTGTGGFVLFTGDIGTGKTTVCRCFLEQIPAACNVAMVFNPKLSVMELLQNICEEFHVTVDTSVGSISLKSYVDALNAFLLQSHATGQSNVLIIDEAQNLQPEVLEQLRLLTNLETHERKLLQIVLIGQPELRTMLERPDLEQLAQRVIARYHLESLNLADTTRYRQHRLTVAGHSGRLPFDEKALRRIYALTRGVPRRINLLCGRSLLGAWANGLHLVDRNMIDKAAAEVFGPNSKGPRPGSMFAAAALGALGAMALSLAVALHFWPRAVATEPVVAKVVPTAPVPAASAAPLAVAITPNTVPKVPVDLEAVLPQLNSGMGPAWRERRNQRQARSSSQNSGRPMSSTGSSAASGRGDNPLAGFGIVTLASLLPVMCVLGIGIYLHQQGNLPLAATESATRLWYQETPVAELLGALRAILPLVLLLALLATANLVFHLAGLGVFEVPAMTPLHAALGLIIMIESVIAGRVVPAFTMSALPGLRIQTSSTQEQLTLGLTAVGMLLWVFGPAGLWGFGGLLAAALLHAIRLWHWQPLRTRHKPVLWILHVAYAWIALGLLLLALAQIGLLPVSAGVHALAVGATGGLIIGMVTRTARGHTARPLAVSRLEVVAYALVMTAALLRVLLPLLLPGFYSTALVLGAAAWSAGFLIYLRVYAPWLTQTRLDGKDG